jgi:hypothetical protein
MGVSCVLVPTGVAKSGLPCILRYSFGVTYISISGAMGLRLSATVAEALCVS